MILGLVNSNKLTELFAAQGIWVNQSQILAADGINVLNNEFINEHPLIHEQKSRINDLSMMMGVLFMIPDYDDQAGSAPILPVEYLPTFE
jgi:hypothetical protein